MRLRRRREAPPPYSEALIAEQVDGETADRDGSRASAERAYRAALWNLEVPVWALGGLRWRLVLLGRACHQAAIAAADGDAAGLRAGSSPLRSRAWEELAAELDVSAPRPGEAKGWQALDRSLSRLRAVVDGDGAPSLAVHAIAYQQVAEACDRVAQELLRFEEPHRDDQCWFCGAERAEVDRVFAGRWAAICDSCVALCHDLLNA
jgi:ClpX C4-type zinc finger